MEILRKHLGRRDFLRVSTLAAASALLPARLFAKPEDFTTISVLHTTDLHSHILPTTSYEGLQDVGGLARCASQIRLWRRQVPNSLLVDAGDVYQGTESGYRTKGRRMIESFHLLNYDGWVVGNHEFDWGIEPIRDAVSRSQMAVLVSNVRTEGKEWGNLRPWILRDFDGFRVAVIGVTTPGMPYWFRPEFLNGFEVFDPLESVRSALLELRGEKPDAVVLVGHMGLRIGGDDFANRTEALLKEFPEITAFIGGHTHRDVPDQSVHGRPFTQASYHGIHCGKLDLVFEKSSRRLVGVQPVTTLMDSKVTMDPAILALHSEDLENSRKILETPVGILETELSVESAPGRPSDLERLIGLAVSRGLQKKGIRVDGVFHGMFWPEGPVPAGEKTIADLWKILPYENYIVTAELGLEQLVAILEENYGTRGFRSLLGMEVSVEGRGAGRSVTGIRFASGVPVGREDRVVVAFNSFDAQSAGQRLMRLREILQRPETNATLRDLQTRTALIDFFQEAKTVSLTA